MTFLRQHSQQPLQQLLPILSLNKFAYCLGIHRKKIEKLAEEAHSYYAQFSKKIGTKERIIDNPRGLLKEVQKRINDRIFGEISFPDFVIGGVKGRKPFEHPQRHINKAIVITVDVKDCFPSITNKQVFNVWYIQLECSPEVARLATKLTTRIGHLPLGAPTSDCLARLALQPCLEKVNEIAKENGLEGSQYTDDSAFSGKAMPKNFITSIVREFLKHGFKIKRSKIKVMRSNEPQIVTKKLVNKKVSIPKTERHKIRAALYELKNTDPKVSIYRKRYRSLKGRISNLRDFHPNLAKKMLERLNQLPIPDKRL